MPEGLTISAAWERLNEGSVEETAAFGMMEITALDVLLTEGEDAFVNRLRNGPFVSNYHCAEWFAWNWWRLRWEARSDSGDWALAHKMSSIGQGYVWPDISISSDGERIVLDAKPSRQRRHNSFRFIKNIAVAVTAKAFEDAVDGYIGQVISQLRAEAVGPTNLDRIWLELQDERRDPLLSRQRRLEALMGYEPGEAVDGILKGLVADADDFGDSAAFEMAAHHSATHGRVRRADDFRRAADASGFDARPADAAHLSQDIRFPAFGSDPAWKRGAAVAVALRQQEKLGLEAFSNPKLETLAGVASGAIQDRERRDVDLAFTLDSTGRSKIVLRSRWETGRRFELARLIGDRVAMGQSGLLHPATSAHTYRQKVQRAFAAEFLCPFNTLLETLGGDYSPASIEDAGHVFGISERAVRAVLVNHGHIDRDQMEADIADVSMV